MPPAFLIPSLIVTTFARPGCARSTTMLRSVELDDQMSVATDAKQRRVTNVDVNQPGRLTLHYCGVQGRA